MKNQYPDKKKIVENLHRIDDIVVFGIGKRGMDLC